MLTAGTTPDLSRAESAIRAPPGKEPSHTLSLVLVGAIARADPPNLYPYRSSFDVGSRGTYETFCRGCAGIGSGPGVIVLAGESAVAGEGVVDARGGGGSDALVDGQGLAQERDALVVVAVAQIAAAGPFQGARLFQRCADLAGDGQGLGWTLALRIRLHTVLRPLAAVMAREPPFGMPRTMSVPLVADTQNRLFWRIGNWPGS
jgi:hypothetical protein